MAREILHCTFLVQLGLKPLFADVFGNRNGLFHMVFNRTVENCHGPFTLLSPRNETVPLELRALGFWLVGRARMLTSRIRGSCYPFRVLASVISKLVSHLSPHR